MRNFLKRALGIEDLTDACGLMLIAIGRLASYFEKERAKRRELEARLEQAEKWIAHMREKDSASYALRET
jgi:hypothetical protein